MWSLGLFYQLFSSFVPKTLSSFSHVVLVPTTDAVCREKNIDLLWKLFNFTYYGENNITVQNYGNLWKLLNFTQTYDQQNDYMI